MAQRILVYALAILVFSWAAADDDEKSRKICVDILEQSEENFIKCLKKKESFRIENAEQDVLVWLCCLGYFEDVEPTYIQRLDPRLLLFLKHTKSPIAVASFIRTCSRQPGSNSNKLTVQGFRQWQSNNDDDDDDDDGDDNYNSLDRRRCPS